MLGHGHVCNESLAVVCIYGICEHGCGYIRYKRNVSFMDAQRILRCVAIRLYYLRGTMQ